MKLSTIIMLCVALALSACTGIVESSEKASHGIRSGIYNTAEKVQELTRYNPPPRELQAPQRGYCYKSVSDIVCYNEPQPEITNKMVGYQGEPPYGGYQAAAVYTNAAPIQQVQPIQPVKPVGVAHGEVKPFFVKEAPYIKPDGTVQQSVKVLPNTAINVQGHSGDAVIKPGSYPRSESTIVQGDNPAVLMPRY
jgi:hypothetical protein